METADVVVVGGGVIGCSVAYHLAGRGCSGVVLLERDVLGSGITSTAIGGIRQQFASRLHVRLSRESMQWYRSFPGETGHDLGFRATGYLFLATHPDDLAIFGPAVAMQRDLGVDARLLSPDGVREILPQMQTDGLLGAAYSPEDGRADVHSTVQGLAHRARELGAVLYQGAEVTGLLRDRAGRVVGVRSTRGSISAPMVVNAAGVYAPQLSRMAGLDLPVRPFRRDTWVSAPFAALPRAFPTIVDRQTGWTLSRDGERVFMSGERAGQSDYGTVPNWLAIPRAAQMIMERIPAVADLQIMRGWAGSLDMSPDHHALLGEFPEVPGLFHACGFSGHGFMHAPAIGRLVADWILDGTVESEWAGLSVNRLAAGSSLHEAYIPHGPVFSRSEG